MPPMPTIFRSFSGSQPIFLASMRANTQVVEPTTVTPMVAPLRSSTRLICGATVSVKWFFSRMVAMARIVVPRSRNTSGSVAPVKPMSAEPASTPLSMSGPPLKGMNSASSPFWLKKPFSSPTRVGPAIPKSPSTTPPILTGSSRGWAEAGPSLTAPAATAPPAIVVRNRRLVVPLSIRASPLRKELAPAPQPVVEMLQEQHHRDGQHGDDRRGGEELRRLERDRQPLHEKAHAAIAREHLGQEHAEHGEDHPHSHACQHRRQHRRIESQAEDQGDPRQDEDLGNPVERHDIGHHHVVEQPPRAEQQAGSHPQEHRHAVADEGLEERLPEPRQGFACRSGEGAGHLRRSGDEEWIDPAPAARGLPHEGEGRDRQRLPGDHAQPAHRLTRASRSAPAPSMASTAAAMMSTSAAYSCVISRP